MILSNANLIDVVSGKIVPLSQIVTNGDRIVSIGKNKTRVSTGTIDLNGKFVSPGLIDLHVHVAEEPETDRAKKFHFDESEPKSIARMKRNLKKALLAGVTTLRDVGSFAGRGLLAKRLVEQGVIIGPRIFSCGHSLTPPKGHWFERSREVIDNPKAIRSAIEEEIQNGADFIKIMIEKPVFFSESTVQTAVATTHRLGKKISAHTAFPKSINLAIQCGVDTLEHSGTVPSRLINKILKNNTTVIPTYYSAYISVKDPIGSLLYDTDASITGTQEEIMKIFKDWLNLLRAGLPKLFKTQIKVGAGTDAGFPLFPFNSVIKEIQALNKLGLSNLKSLQAATTVAAEVLGQKDQLGVIKAGSLADIIVVPKNPLEDLSSLENVKLVIKDGQIYNNNLKTSLNSP